MFITWEQYRFEKRRKISNILLSKIIIKLLRYKKWKGTSEAMGDMKFLFLESEIVLHQRFGIVVEKIHYPDNIISFTGETVKC